MKAKFARLPFIIFSSAAAIRISHRPIAPESLLPKLNEGSCESIEMVPKAEKFHDGQWPVCVSSLTTRSECVVFTGGACDDITFEIAMRERGCSVHTFDPTLKDIEGWIRSAASTSSIAKQHGVQLHEWALGGNDTVVEAGGMPYAWPGMDYGMQTNSQPWKVKTLRGAMEALNYTSIDVLKVDVEGAEWDLLEAALSDPLSRRSLQQGMINQIMFEVHFMPPKGTKHAKSPRHPYDTDAKNMKFQSMLAELVAMGYEMFWHVPNDKDRFCHNIGLIWKGKP